jgi:glucokinase
MQEVIDCEALVHSRRDCKIVPAELGESIGDYAALSVAANVL